MNILFLCTHNSCRSILAEAISRELGGSRLHVRSAGSRPEGHIHPMARRHLHEAGYPVEELVSKGLDDISDFAPDIVITVCDNAAAEPCPLWLGDALKVHWGLPDPSRLEAEDAIRSVAFEALIERIEHRINALLEHPIENMGMAEIEGLLNKIAREY